MKSMRFGLNSVRLLAAMVALAVLAMSVSRLNAANTEDVIFNFSTTAEGLQPHATLIADKSGNLYGTTTYGGSFANGGVSGNGLVFELTPTGTGWTETVLYEFQGGSDDGANPFEALTMDAAICMGRQVLAGTKIVRVDAELFLSSLRPLSQAALGPRLCCTASPLATETARSAP